MRTAATGVVLSPFVTPVPWFGRGAVLGLLVVLCGLSVLAWRRNWAPTLGQALLVALVVRVVGVALSYGHTPHDASLYFRHAGELVQMGLDPLTRLPRFQWNFLPLMPYVFAGELATGLPWEIGGKLVPVLADLWSVAILGRLATAGRGARARILYALSPLSLLVTCWHGQVEPVGVSLGLTALVLAQRQRGGWAGTFLGLAAASKTWPVLFVFGVLRDLRPRERLPSLAAAGAVLAAFLLSTAVLLGDQLGEAVHLMAGYRSFIGTWGWSGTLNALHLVGAGYTGPEVDPYQKVGSLLLAATLLLVVLCTRRLAGPDLVLVVMLAFLATTAGFGTQYLLWPCALAYARPGRGTGAFLTASAAYAGYVYLAYLPALYVYQRTGTGGPGIAANLVLQLGSLPVIACAVVAALSRVSVPAPRRADAPSRPDPAPRR